MARTVTISAATVMMKKNTVHENAMHEALFLVLHRRCEVEPYPGRCIAEHDAVSEVACTDPLACP